MTEKRLELTQTSQRHTLTFEHDQNIAEFDQITTVRNKRVGLNLTENQNIISITTTTTIRVNMNKNIFFWSSSPC